MQHTAPKSSDLKWRFTVCHSSVSAQAALLLSRGLTCTMTLNWPIGWSLGSPLQLTGLSLLVFAWSFSPQTSLQHEDLRAEIQEGKSPVWGPLSSLCLLSWLLSCWPRLISWPKSESMWKRKAIGVAMKSMANRGLLLLTVYLIAYCSISSAVFHIRMVSWKMLKALPWEKDFSGQGCVH